MKQTVILGMSGGVDSSVAAYLLKEQGYHVIGLFMQNWEEDDNSNCLAIEDYKDAKAVAKLLDIEIHNINFAQNYWDDVFEIFLEEYKKGHTPNPDILCNKEIKFKAFLNYAKKEWNCDYIATGHYVQSEKKDGFHQLLRGVDPNKDQSYFLYALSQNQIKSALFPVGNYDKSQIRQLAIELNLPTAKKKDSTGICFIGEKNFNTFLNDYLPAQPGDIYCIDTKALLGQHQGLMFHTIGQRKGLHIGGVKNRSDLPWYVIAKNLDKNILLVTQNADHPSFFSHSLTANNLNWVASKPSPNQTLTAKIRYRQNDIPVLIKTLTDTHCQVEFPKLARAVTLGQSIVFYDGPICLGGGIITDNTLIQPIEDF